MKKLLAILPLALAGCAQPQPTAPTKTIGMANPRRYTVSNPAAPGCRANAAGRRTQCKLPSGETLDEWALWRRDHPAKS
jgi:putative hemolysin